MEKSKKGIRAAIATVIASIILAIFGAIYVNAEMIGLTGTPNPRHLFS